MKGVLLRDCIVLTREGRLMIRVLVYTVRQWYFRYLSGSISRLVCLLFDLFRALLLGLCYVSCSSQAD
jgi:hypothetical protein